MNARPDHRAIETQVVVDGALETMVLVQGLDTASLAARDLHAAVILTKVARSRLARLVADARDEDTPWAEIGHILGTGRLLALLRYGPRWRTRGTPLELD